MGLRAILRTPTLMRGTTALFPLYFAGVVLLSTIIDFVSAFITFVSHPDTGREAAFSLVSAFVRPGSSFVVLVFVIVIAFLRGDISDRRALNRPMAETRRTPAAKIAGWIAVVGGGILVVLVVYLGVALWGDAQRVAASYGEDSTAVGLVILGLALAGLVIAGVPLWLGVCVLRSRAWARYALIIYCALAFIAIVVWPTLQRIDLLGFGVVAVGVLLLWSELRERRMTGSLRDCWRGVALLGFNLVAVAMFAAFALDIDGDTTGVLGFVAGLSMIWYFLGSLLVGMWAVNKDENEFWASLHAMLIIAAPLLISLLVLGKAIIGAFSGAPAS